MLSEPDPPDPNAAQPRLGVRQRSRQPPGKGGPRGKGRPGGPKPPAARDRKGPRKRR